MRGPVAEFLLILLTITGAAVGKDKKEKHAGLPGDVLRARTVMVVIAPHAGEPLKDLQANAPLKTTLKKR
jgi:hypothetical protein